MTYYYNDQIYDNKTTVDDAVAEFLKRYESTAGLSRHKMYARRVPVRYNDWLKDGSPIPFHQEVEREPMVEINMPQDRFRDLVEKERWTSKVEQEAHYYKKRYMQEVEDDKIRNRNPSVKKAWEQYQMLLELAR
jgi:hypothetical protein